MPLTPANAPTGFRLYQVGGQGNAFRIQREVATDREKDLMVGDAYKFESDGTVSRLTDPTYTGKIGIVEGIVLKAIETAPQGPVSQDYIPLSESGAVIGIEDDQALFEVMDADALGFVAATDTNKVTDINDADGDRPLRRSRQSVLSGQEGGVGQFTMISLVPSPADNPDAVPFNRVIVRVNQTILE